MYQFCLKNLPISLHLTNTLYPINDFYVRRVGRPSKEWVKDFIADVKAVFGSLERACELPTDAYK